MRYFLLLLLAVSFTAYADTIRCYSNGKEIYSGHPTAVLYDGTSFLAKYIQYDDIIFTRNCIYKVNKYASSKRPRSKNQEGFFGERA